MTVTGERARDARAGKNGRNFVIRRALLSVVFQAGDP